MASESFDSALERAATRCGVETRFWDIFGREHIASLETRKAIIQALGMTPDSAESLSTAIADRERHEWNQLLPPSIVLPKGDDTIFVSVFLPEKDLHNSAQFRLSLESGEERSISAPLSGMPVEERRRFESDWVRLRVGLPFAVPLGYHRLELRIGDKVAHSTLIVAPESCWIPKELSSGGKSAGFAVALYGLRSARNWGFGDFTDLHQLCSWAGRELGVSFIALNPLHAIHNRRPYNTSPYLPNSLFFQNSLYIDVEGIEEWKTSRRAQACFASPAVRTELNALRNAPEVEYERVQTLKLRFLKLLFVDFLRRHWQTDSPRARQFKAFQLEAGELLSRFGLYCALDEHLHRANPDLWIWTNWPKEYQDPVSPEARAFARKHWRSVLFFQYAAWQAATQLEAAQQHALRAGLSIGLYHDLALATDRFGSDIWAHRDFFAPGCRVGSPPDDFSPGGQDWGFPAPNPVRHREDGYHLFRESIRRSCRFGGALRIDHVMRFFRLYWIPDGMDATQGAYVKDSAEDLVRILALESVRGRLLVVGEDLGTVEPYIREMLAKYGVLSYRLFPFERHADGSYRHPHEYPRQALVSSSTHDLPTLAGFWKGSDIEARRSAGVLDEQGYGNQWADRSRDKQRMLDALSRCGLLPVNYPLDARKVNELDQPLHRAIIAFLSSTPSMLMLINQEDLTWETNQQNLPGTTSQYPNWGRKMRWTLEELETDPEAVAAARGMKEQLRSTHRV